MSDFIDITEEPLLVDLVSSKVTDTCTGATSLFVGTTRDNFQGKKVIKLEYEAYIPMARKKMKELCNRLRVKWPDLYNIAVYHRLGLVGPCEASVIIGISSAHRKASLEALHFAIDELKASVPIWKKELYEDGSEWKENKECFWRTQNIPDDNQAAGKADSNMVQIHATNQELDKRIDQFISAKRSELDTNNILEFCGPAGATSCARTDAVLVKKKDSKSHLRKSIVTNQAGPNPSMTTALDERLGNMEKIVLSSNVPVPLDVYARLKALEDRILLLERMECNNPLSSQPVQSEDTGNDRKEELTQSLLEINSEIEQLRNELK